MEVAAEEGSLAGAACTASAGGTQQGEEHTWAEAEGIDHTPAPRTWGRPPGAGRGRRGCSRQAWGCRPGMAGALRAEWGRVEAQERLEIVFIRIL